MSSFKVRWMLAVSGWWLVVNQKFLKQLSINNYQLAILSFLPFTFYFLPFNVAVGMGNGIGNLSQVPPSPPPTLPPSSYRVIVNSNQDGNIQPDEGLTLREAIEVVNGTLSVDKLSAAEKALVQPATGGASRIEFNLPAGASTIQLQTVLPDLASPGLVVDGATQPGYDSTKSATAEIAIPIPVVTITPAADKEVFRGLTVVADNVTIRGLSLYGFNSSPIKQQLGNLLIYDGVPKPTTLTTPPGDIVIAHRFPPPDISRQQPPNSSSPFSDRDVPPKNVVIEDNWLGMAADEKMPEKTSAFGVYVFNSQGATIRRNRIYYHDGSAIITSVRGDSTVVQQNIIVANGIAGMPDALRFEGVVTKSRVLGNLICANDGAGVYLFKPEGDVELANNKITYNGRRLRRAAVYLMGENHRVTGNEIDNQAGPGVVVSAFPNTGRNLITNNKFAVLEGLSIDLNTNRNLDVSDFQKGDGPNAQRNSDNRRRDTGNGAINAPEFTARTFSPSGSITVSGKADAGSEVTIYRLGDYQQGKQAMYDPGYGALSQPLATVPVDKEGKFSTTVSGLSQGDMVSAIASDPKYGTSEPAIAALIGEPGTRPTLSSNPPRTPIPIPQCTTRPAPPTPPIPPEKPPEIPPPPLRIKVPKNIHFALDKSFISPTSAAVLDRVAEVLLQYPVIVIDIQGHTDPRASDEYNLALGRRRALATRNYLIRKGVPPERMTIRSFGESQLLGNGTNRVDYARDRRAEIEFKDVRGVEIIIEPQEEDLQLEPARRQQPPARRTPPRSRTRGRR